MNKSIVNKGTIKNINTTTSLTRRKFLGILLFAIFLATLVEPQFLAALILSMFLSSLVDRQFLNILILGMLFSANKINAQNTAANEFKFIMGNSLSLQQQENCQKMKNRISFISDNFEHSRQALSLSKNQLTINCVNEKHKTNQVGHLNVFFNAGTQTLQLDALGVAPDELISHELVHARAFFANRKCGVRVGEAGVPVHPVNEWSLKELNDAFDAGDKRIAEFKQLTQKKDQNKALTQKEKKQLKEYENACKGVIKVKQKFYVSEKESQFITLGLKKSSPYRAQADAFGGQFDFCEAGFESSTKKYYIIGLPVEEKTTIILLPQVVKMTLAADKKLEAPQHRLAEREAYTFQSLPENAQKVFYKEAYVLRQKNIEQCEKHDSPRIEL